MLPAFLATVLFASSVLFASHSIREIGSARANLARITLAAVFLGIWAHGWGGGLNGAGLPWFLLSGMVGFGLGDIALFGSLSRVGPRLAILLTQCLATPIAGVAEYVLLGSRPSWGEMGCSAVILTGVMLALAPDKHWEGERRVFQMGVLCGIGSALGQAFGAVLSRKGMAVATAAGSVVDGGTVAYQRILAGVLTTLVMGWMLNRSKRGESGAGVSWGAWGRAVPWIACNALAGPTVGVACFQWALAESPSAKVMPVIATSPLVTMILAYLFLKTQPSKRAVWGGVVAVVGAVGLALLRAPVSH